VIEAVGRGDLKPSFVDRALDEPLSGPEGIAAAEPEPLVLFDVSYPDVAFEVDEDALASARDVFERRHRRRLAAARVAAALSPEP
jgi:tRNA pseudouridine38-40 synthase